MGGDERDAAADKLNRSGEDPAAESGAGYGSHAPVEDEQEGAPKEQSS